VKCGWPKLIRTADLANWTACNTGNSPAPQGVEESWAQIAVASKAPVAELRMVPNQPLVFTGDGQKRSEDAIIAFTWAKFMNTGDKRWPLRLPMTKSAVRAMDTITSFLASPEGGKAKVDNFVVCGGSKRGWTTWTTAAVVVENIDRCPDTARFTRPCPAFGPLSDMHAARPSGIKRSQPFIRQLPGRGMSVCCSFARYYGADVMPRMIGAGNRRKRLERKELHVDQKLWSTGRVG